MFRGGEGEGRGKEVKGRRGRTLEACLDYVKRVDDEGGDCTGAEASAGLDQRGGEARMIFIHSKGVELFMAWGLAVFKGSRRGVEIICR